MEVKVSIPEGVEARLEGFRLTLKGPLGELDRDFYNRGIANLIKMKLSGNEVTISTKEESKRVKAILGTLKAHVNSLSEGVTKGYKYSLKVHHVHFPMSLERKGNEVIIKNFIGQKDIRKSKIIEGIDVKIEKQEITVSGLDKEKVGQTAANFELATRQCKNDRRRFQDGIYIVEKAAPLNQ
jgi:large subunit ribosomal protein L6